MTHMIAAFGFGPFDVSWLSTALVLTTPLLFAALGELVSERAGVLNVGLEGMMLSGAFFSYLVTSKTGSLTEGAIAGLLAGMFFAVVMGVLAIEAGADQIVAGIGINLAATGLTSYLFDQIYSSSAQDVIPTIGALRIPGLADIPKIGPVLFDQDPLLYLAFLSVPIVWFLLYRTRWGLSIRSAGETPEAADTAGVSIRRVRWGGVLTAGFMAGLGGAYLVIVDVGIFHQEMTAGRGFLALVAVIFGRWSPVGVLGACFALGGTDALQLRLAAQEDVPHAVWMVVALVAVVFVIYQVNAWRKRRMQRRFGTTTVLAVAVAGFVLYGTEAGVALPTQVWRALPYLLALVVLGGSLTRARMPSKLTLPYRRGDT